MKNKTLPLLACLLLGFLAPASAQDVIDKVADETCSCLENRLPAGGLEGGQLEMILGLCMLEAGNKHSDELEAKLGMKMNSVESMEKLGEIVGERLAVGCNKFMEVLFAMMAEEDNTIMDELMEGMASVGESLVGKVVEVKGEELLTIKIKSAGKMHTFHVIGSFEGQSVIEQGRALIGETVHIEFTETEIYSPKEKAFVGVKEIKKIEIE